MSSRLGVYEVYRAGLASIQYPVFINQGSHKENIPWMDRHLSRMVF